MPSSQLAWAHFRKSLWIGFLWLPVGAALAGLGQAWVDRPSYAAAAAPLTLDLLTESLLTAGAWALGGAWWGAIFLGIPALVFGVLRQPLMRRLFDFCRANAPHSNLDLALAGTFVLFELPVGLIGLLTSGSQAYRYPVGVICFGLSLPWLVGSLWATWSIRDELSTPA